jgi:hypothetical protein
MRYLIILLLLIGCAAPQQTFHKIVILPARTVHILSENEMTREVLKRVSQYPGIYKSEWTSFQTEKEIWVTGEKNASGEYIIHALKLGHEDCHLIRTIDPEFVNPDK